jgi:hypothetical protein
MDRVGVEPTTSAICKTVKAAFSYLNAATMEEKLFKFHTLQFEMFLVLYLVSSRKKKEKTTWLGC